MKSKIKILITDDSQTIREAIVSMLANDPKFEYIIITAENGVEGCKMAYKEQPDIILMDIEMPVMDGIKATNKIKSNNQLLDIPIVVMSTSSTLKAAFLAGADDFIIKPFTEFELLLRLNFNIKLAHKAMELKDQHAVLQMQKDEVDQQNKIISMQQNELLEDMNYASHIQNAISPRKETLNELCKSYFVINRPKNIVSGDFYWVSKKDERYFFVVGDCTGHGTSGALMTMVGSAFLNEIINNVPFSNPGSILDELRKRVIKLLQQRGDIGEASNGMDVSLCIFDPKTRKLEYAGANNPIYIVRENQELEVFKADRMPIGIYINHRTPFNSIETTLGTDDNLYMFSDGYADQFGGPRGKKFRYKQFKELLTSYAALETNKQLKQIENTLNNWIEGYEQIDDILLVGFKL